MLERLGVAVEGETYWVLLTYEEYYDMFKFKVNKRLIRNWCGI